MTDQVRGDAALAAGRWVKWIGGASNQDLDALEDLAGIPGSARRMEAGPARELYLKTLDCKAYWPLIRCPVMFLGATNDFNSPMELVIRGFRSLPLKSWSDD